MEKQSFFVFYENPFDKRARVLYNTQASKSFVLAVWQVWAQDLRHPPAFGFGIRV